MKKEHCANCSGILISRKIDYDKKIGSKRVLFQDVPASVCSSCDEVWIEGKVAEKMEKLFAKGKKPTRWIKIPIWSLSRPA